MSHVWEWENIFEIPSDKFQELMEGDSWTPEQLVEMDRLCGFEVRRANDTPMVS